MLAHASGVKPFAITAQLFVIYIDPDFMRSRVRQK